MCLRDQKRRKGGEGGLEEGGLESSPSGGAGERHGQILLQGKRFRGCRIDRYLCRVTEKQSGKKRIEIGLGLEPSGGSGERHMDRYFCRVRERQRNKKCEIDGVWNLLLIPLGNNPMGFDTFGKLSVYLHNTIYYKLRVSFTQNNPQHYKVFVIIHVNFQIWYFLLLQTLKKKSTVSKMWF